ncbi:hypothetical protein ACFCX0_47060 [Streptomyces sp. NPDC056352]|uniref:hypothetical protein n=1 Tax=Streptomyces sp. NPDC056352 TaxID=3345791 RepID=UPI0035D5F2BB
MTSTDAIFGTHNAGRVALYLNYCLMRRLDWKTPGFLGLAGLQQWLVETPLPSRTSGFDLAFQQHQALFDGGEGLAGHRTALTHTERRRPSRQRGETA